MLGPRQVDQATLFYEFSLESHVSADHMLRYIDRFVDLSTIRGELASFYSHTGRPSVDPELMIRMLLVGYCFGIRSERRLCEEVHLNLAYRWFCRPAKCRDRSTRVHATWLAISPGRKPTQPRDVGRDHPGFVNGIAPYQSFRSPTLPELENLLRI